MGKHQEDGGVANQTLLHLPHPLSLLSLLDLVKASQLKSIVLFAAAP